MMVQQAEMNTPTALKTRIEDAQKAKNKSVLLLVHGNDGARYMPFTLTSADTH